jgi:hypothetical protein
MAFLRPFDLERDFRRVALASGISTFTHPGMRAGTAEYVCIPGTPTLRGYLAPSRVNDARLQRTQRIEL